MDKIFITCHLLYHHCLTIRTFDLTNTKRKTITQRSMALQNRSGNVIMHREGEDDGIMGFLCQKRIKANACSLNCPFVAYLSKIAYHTYLALFYIISLSLSLSI